MTTVAELLITTLSQAGVQRIYGIVGDSLNEITKVLGEQKKIQWIHTRHEEVAAFAAGAEAQLTENLTVCAGSCGPGNLHLINGLYDCHRSQAPVLAIAAHIPSSEIGSDYFQETHPEKLFKECSCFCETVVSKEQMPLLLNQAMQTALSKRGVAVLIISGDMALQEVETKACWTKACPAIIIPGKQQLQEAAKCLNHSQKITLFCGIGATKAHESLMQIASLLKAPIVHTLRGKPFIEYDNPYDVGMTGLIGCSSGYYAMEACDTLLLLGTSFPYRQFYPQKAHIIQIDIEGQQLGKRTKIDMGLIGDVDETLKALLPLLNQKQDDSHLQNALKHYQQARAGFDMLSHQRPDKNGLHPQHLVSMINQHANKDAIFTCDVGTPTVWAARYLHMNGTRRLLGSFNHGSMANALAQSIGAQLSHPTRQVIALCGDGGLGMLLGDLLTLIQHQVPVKLIVFNNQSLNFVQLEMHAAGMIEFGTNLSPTQFADIATAMGILGIRVNHTSELENALKTILQHEGPALLDVRTNSNELIIPPSITFEQIKGFGIYAVKAILDGQGKKIIDLAKTSLWQL